MILDKSKLDFNRNILSIIGGNHANFGNYENQKGDGVATITRDEQQDQAINVIANFGNNRSIKLGSNCII